MLATVCSQSTEYIDDNSVSWQDLMYVTNDIDACRLRGHRLQTIWSNNTPRKVSLMCLNCSDAAKTVMVAHGIDTLGFGAWRSRRKEAAE